MPLEFLASHLDEDVLKSLLKDFKSKNPEGPLNKEKVFVFFKEQILNTLREEYEYYNQKMKEFLNRVYKEAPDSTFQEWLNIDEETKNRGRQKKSGFDGTNGTTLISSGSISDNDDIDPDLLAINRYHFVRQFQMFQRLSELNKRNLENVEQWDAESHGVYLAFMLRSECLKVSGELLLEKNSGSKVSSDLTEYLDLLRSSITLLAPTEMSEFLLTIPNDLFSNHELRTHGGLLFVNFEDDYDYRSATPKKPNLYKPRNNTSLN